MVLKVKKIMDREFESWYLSRRGGMEFAIKL